MTWANNFLKHYYGNKHAAKVIYGTILIFVALIALSSSGVKSAELAALDAFVGALTIIIAEDYAEIIGFTIKRKRPLSKSERLEIVEDTLAVCSFIFVPSIILIVSRTGLYGLTTAFYASFGYCLLVLFVFSYWAGKLSGSTNQKAALIAVITTLIGLAIIVVKYVATH